MLECDGQTPAPHPVFSLSFSSVDPSTALFWEKWVDFSQEGRTFRVSISPVSMFNFRVGIAGFQTFHQKAVYDPNSREVEAGG